MKKDFESIMDTMFPPFPKEAIKELIEKVSQFGGITEALRIEKLVFIDKAFLTEFVDHVYDELKVVPSIKPIVELSFDKEGNKIVSINKYMVTID